MYDRILVPTDGSAGTERALEHALTIALDHDSTIHAVYVVNRQFYLAAAKERQEDVKSDLRHEGEQAVELITDRAEAAGLDAESAILDGTPHRELLEYADDHDIDLVVIGTHGKTGRDRLVTLGSVTERIVENATMPVLTVRIDEN